MPLVTFYFELHQPYRLHPDTSKFLWNEQNEEVFHKVANKCYLPATLMFAELIRENPKFKVTFSMSGTFLEQAENYDPKVIEALRELLDAGKEHHQVEYLEETYYHSLAGLFKDPRKREFKDQVTLHRQKMKDLFGLRPSSFRNTELMYNNEIANIVADMGYKAILCEQRDDMFTPRDGKAISPNAVFRPKGRGSRAREMVVLARNRNLSDDVAFRFRHGQMTPDDYLKFLARVDGESVVLGYDYEHIGEHLWSDTGIFDFWRGLARSIGNYPNVVACNPTEIAEKLKDAECPVLDIHPLSTSSWADMERNTQGWLGSSTQYALFQDLENLEQEVHHAGKTLLDNWRMLTTSDHLYYLHEGKGADRTVHDYFSPYGSHAAAAYVLTRNIDNLRANLKTFYIGKEVRKTPVVIIAPETSRLPAGMGHIASLVSGKSGGLGEVIGAICKGLSERDIATHLVTLNLKRRFRQESHVSEEEWIRSRHRLDSKNVHLVTSSVFENYSNAYEGNPAFTAAEFQRQLINTYLKEIRSQYEGRAIIHTHDWMAGGAFAAYAKMRQIPMLHTIHNTHTAFIPMRMHEGINVDRLRDNLYIEWQGDQEGVDAQATAVKNATLVSSVGKRFLDEIVHDYFLDRPIIPWSVRQELKVKYNNHNTVVIPNGISPEVFPENQKEEPDVDKPGLAKTFGDSSSGIIEAKKLNLVKFQKQMGLKVDAEAIMLFWPSRLDPSQKGVELLEDMALKLLYNNPDTQIAVVGNPVGNEHYHREVIGRLACASNGRMAYAEFDNDLCMLGYAAASDVFGASLYEPFGQIDVVGNLYGATATNRDTGGYHDKISPLSLKAWGAPQDNGNGVLFKNYDSGGLRWALEQTINNHRFFRKHPGQWERQAYRIMREAQKNWSLQHMVAGYLDVYERLNRGKPLS